MGLGERLRRWAARLDGAGFGIFGPAQVGRAEPNEPIVRHSPCRLCGNPMEEHRIVGRGGAGRMYCPPTTSGTEQADRPAAS